MRVSIRDLNQRVDALTPPQFDVGYLMRRGEARRRRRRAGLVAAVTAAVVAVVGGTLLASPGSRNAAPDVPPAHHKNTAPDDVETRLADRRLTYAVGTTIHWGDRTIDVGPQAHGRHAQHLSLDYVDATDDGAVFVTGPDLERSGGEWGVAVGDATVWFTDGSTPVRIGTTSGNSVRGFQIASSAAGSTLAWSEGTDEQGGQVVVYDTAQMRERARFGAGDARPLAVYDDVVYWSPGGSSCMGFGWGFVECEGTGPVMRFDTATGQQSRVRVADYLADRRARPGLLTGPSDHGRGGLFLHLLRRGDRLVADGGEPGAEFTPTVALTGRSLRLHLPAGDRNPDDLAITQWLDPDRVVLVDTDSYDGTDLLTCRLSTGRCRLAVRLPDANYTEPGPVGIHG